MWLTFTILLHTKELLISCKFLKRVKRESKLQEVLRIDNVYERANNDFYLDSIDSIKTNAPLVEHVRTDVLQVFRVQSPQQKQEEVITTIIADGCCEGNLREQQ